MADPSSRKSRQYPAGPPSARAAARSACAASRIPGGVVRERPHQARLDNTALTRGGAGLVHHPIRQLDRTAGVPVGDQQPGQGEPRVLGQVGGWIGRFGGPVPGPRPRVGEPALGDADARPGGGDRSDVGEVARPVVRLGLIEHRHRGIQIAAGTVQSGRDGEPAMPVLRQRPTVTQLVGDLQLAPGRLDPALFPQDVGEPDMQVARGVQRRSTMPVRRFQRALVQPSGVVRPALGQDQLGQDDGGPEFVGHLSRRAQAAHRRGKGVHRQSEIACGPGGEAEKSGRCPARAVVVTIGQGQRPLRLGDGARDVPPGLRDRGPVDRDHGRQPTQFQLARPDRRSQPG